jgi:nitroreductase
LFLAKAVPEDVLKKIIEAGASAPSSEDCQPGHFVVVKDKTRKEFLGELKGEGNKNHILTAPVSVIVCVDTEKSPTRWIEDGVAAAENMLLAAHELGAGSVYVTGFKKEKPEIEKQIKEKFGMPENIVPIAILPVGYPDPSEEMHKKEVMDAEKRTHYDEW